MEKQKVYMTTYISVDVETVGLLPGYHGLLSVGAVPTHDIGNQFHEVICPLNVNSIGSFLNADIDTLEWWEGQPEANRRLNDTYFKDPTKTNILDINKYLNSLEEVASKFIDWLNQFEKPLMFVAWPASFDYPCIQHMFWSAGDMENPFSYRTIDVKSYACGKLGIDFNADRSEFPDWLWEEPDFPHDALSDAIRQAEVFTRLMEYNNGS